MSIGKMKSAQIRFEEWRKIIAYAKDNEITIWEVIKELVEYRGL